MDAIVMAAGEGTRLRPVTRRWAKPVLPIDGRAVIATLLRELHAAACARVYVVTGHLAEQVEALLGDGGAFGVETRFVRQPGVLGSADAVQRALDAGARLPCIVAAADTVFAPGDVARFAEAFEATSAAGALAVRAEPPPRPGRPAVEFQNGRLTRLGGRGPWSAAPLWGIREGFAARLCLDNEPYELGNALAAALEAGEEVAAVTIEPTRDLTDPIDLAEENFPYLRGLPSRADPALQ